MLTTLAGHAPVLWWGAVGWALLPWAVVLALAVWIADRVGGGCEWCLDVRYCSRYISERVRDWREARALRHAYKSEQRKMRLKILS